MKKSVVILLLFGVVIGTGAFVFASKSKSALKLYWFIPDGVRAEPDLFAMFEWAKEGKLPNIKRLIDAGSYGYSYPNFPSHTPTNFATLLTGAYPEVHGVNDGPMRVIGKPLDAVAVPGFRSTAKKISPIWKTLEEAGMRVALISIPGSTPPEIQKGVVLRGRWGGWGADFHALNFESKGNLAQRILQGRAARLFYFGPQLTTYLDPSPAQGWRNSPQGFSPPLELAMVGWGVPIYAYVYDTTDDAMTNYDRIVFSFDKTSPFGDIAQGQWTEWQPIALKWKTEKDTLDVASHVRATVTKLDDNGFFRIRFLYDTLNKTIAYPPEAAEIIEKETGPMIDFVDNFPAQLIYYPEDKKTFTDEAAMSFSWHKSAVGAVVSRLHPNVVIHDIYTPNQMLTSRWWMGFVDPKSARYFDVSISEREKLWEEVRGMYKELDAMVGEILKRADKSTYIVFSSDHGNVPLDRYVNLNNLFAQKGWLQFTIDRQTGEPAIDWKNSKVMYLKMAHVYINPKGLAGDYQRASGADYERLRSEVVRTLRELRDEKGVAPVVDIVEWEKAKERLRLDSDRAGDLIIANAPGYGWNEEMTSDLAVFSTPPVTGYKQALQAKDIPGMWTPFIIAGPGIKQGYFLGNTPFPLVDQYPTVMKALGVELPDAVQGRALDVFD